MVSNSPEPDLHVIRVGHVGCVLLLLAFVTWCFWGDVVGHVWLTFWWDVDWIEARLTTGGGSGVPLCPVRTVVWVVELVVSDRMLEVCDVEADLVLPSCLQMACII